MAINNNCKIYSYSNFGWSIDINKFSSGILIGAPKTNVLQNYEKKNLGVAWYYARYGDLWRKFPFISPNFVKNGEFGKSVAVNDDNFLAIGEPYYSNNNFSETPFDYGFGAVHLYSFNNRPFPELNDPRFDLFTAATEILATLTGNGQKLSQFGYSIDLNNNGDILVVGAPTDVNANNNVTGGKVYLYQNVNNNWQLRHTLTGTGNFGYFGKCVKINSGNLLAVAENESFHIYDYYENTNVRNLAFNNIINENENAFIETANLNNILYKKDFSVPINSTAITLTGWNDSLNNFYFNGQELTIGVDYKTLLPVLQDSLTGTTGYYDTFGRNFSINTNGEILVVGTPSKRNNSSQTVGSIEIFKRNNGKYNLIQGITGTIAGEFFGDNLSTSSDGRIIAVSNISQNNGRVWIYQSNNLSNWTLSQTLSGNPGSLSFGERLALSPDGTVLTVGSRFDIVSPDSTGSMWVYTGGFNQTWTQTQKITGLMNSVGFADIGWPANQVLNSEGTVLGVGFDSKTVGGDLFAGAVSIYTGVGGVYNFSQELIGDPVGQSSGDLFGRSLAITDVGNILTVGSLHDQNFENRTLDGALFIFETGSDKKFFLKQKLRGDLDPLLRQNDRFGYFTDMSADGSIIVTSSQHDEGYALPITNQSVGAFWVYRKNTLGTWDAIHKEIGTGINNFFGLVCKLSRDGSTIVIGEQPVIFGLGTRGSIKIYSQDVFSINDIIFDNQSQLANGSTGILMGIPKSYDATIIKNNSFPLEYNNFQTTSNYNFNKFIDTDIHGETVLIGNPYQSTGVARLYKKVSSVWQNTHSFTGASGFQFFGASVGLDYENNIYIGAPKENVIYFYSGVNNQFIKKIGNNSCEPFSGLGNAIAADKDSNVVAIGSYLKNVENYNIEDGTIFLRNYPDSIPNLPIGLVISNITETGMAINWNSTFGAIYYHLDISTVFNFTTLLTNYNNFKIKGTSQQITGLIPGTIYYIRIRAVNPKGSSPYSNITQITVPVAPNQPTISSVASASFTASWNSVAGASEYRVDVATSDDFTGGFVTDYDDRVVNGTSVSVTGLSPVTTYYVRVRARNTLTANIVTSANSPNAEQLTLTLSPNTPTATNITTTSFTANWNSVTGASSYRLDVSTFSDFTTRLEDYNDLTVNGTSQSITGLTAGTIYYVRVRAVNSAGASSLSSPTLTQITVPLAPNQPTISNVASATFTASWNSVSGASEYRIDVATTSNFTSGFVTGYNDRLVTGTSVSVTGLSPVTTYYVRVRARNTLTANIVESVNSPNAEQLTLPLGPDTPTATNITTISFTANWNSVTDASSYRLDVSTASNFATRLTGYDDLVVNGTSQSITGLTAGTTYYVRVRAVNSAGASSLSSPTLTQITVPLAPNQPTISNVTSATFTASWNSVSGASEYRIDVATTSNFTSGFVTGYNDRLVTGTSVSVTGLSPVTTYYVRVRARNTLTANIVTSANSPNAEQLTLTLSPNTPTATNITTISFTANWNSVTDASSYRLDVSTVSNFATRLTGYDDLVVNGTSQSITGLTAGTIYYVRVRAVNSAGTSPNSATLTQITVPNAPNSPIFINVTDNSLSITWDLVTGASAYEIDVSTNVNFSSFVGIYNGYTVTSNSPAINITGLTDGVVYYVRIRAKNTAGTSLNSPTGSQRTLPAAPSPITINTVTSTSFRVNWGAVSNISNYRLDVYTDVNLTEFQPGYNNLFVSSGTLFQNVTGLSPGTIYYVRVRAESIAGTGPNSTVVSQLTAPAAPEEPIIFNVTPNSFSITWNLVTAASSYEIDVSTNVNFSSFVGIYNGYTVTSNSPAINITGLTGRTVYYVRIRAKNVGGTSSNSPTASETTLPSVVNQTIDNITSTSFRVNWGAVSNISNYRLDVYTNASLTEFQPGYNNLFVSSGTLFQNVTGLSPGTIYYVRVRAESTTGTSPNPLVVSQFTTPNIPNQPTFSSVTQNSFRVNWNSVTGASRYLLDVSTVSNFATFVINGRDTGSSTFSDVTGLSTGTIYYVRVRANNNQTSVSVTSNNSTTASQFTNVNTPTISLITTNSFVVSWTAILGALGTMNYIFQLSTNSSFSSFVSGYEDLLLTTNSISVTGLSPGVRYYARIKSENSSYISTSFGTARDQFTVPNAPNQPTFSNIEATYFRVLWNSVTGASRYLLDVSTVSNFATFVINGRDTGSSTFSDVTGLLATTTYYARVRANNNQTSVSVTSNNSQVGTQQTLVNLETPLNLRVPTANQNSFTVEWDPVNTATFYQIQVSTDNTFTVNSAFILNNTSVSGTTRTVSVGDPKIPYYIRVRAVNSRQTGSYSLFLTQIGIPATPPTPSSSTITSTSATISWPIVAGAISYKIEIATNINFNSATTLQTQRSFINITNLNSGTTYHTRISAVGNVDESGYSNTLTFTTL